MPRDYCAAAAGAGGAEVVNGPRDPLDEDVDDEEEVDSALLVAGSD